MAVPSLSPSLSTGGATRRFKVLISTAQPRTDRLDGSRNVYNGKANGMAISSRLCLRVKLTPSSPWSVWAGPPPHDHPAIRAAAASDFCDSPVLCLASLPPTAEIAAPTIQRVDPKDIHSCTTYLSEKTVVQRRESHDIAVLHQARMMLLLCLTLSLSTHVVSGRISVRELWGWVMGGDNTGFRATIS